MFKLPETIKGQVRLQASEVMHAQEEAANRFRVGRFSA